jgi:signal transduction histidine kinase
MEEHEEDTGITRTVLHVEIQDTGLGIREEDRHKLFK